VEVDRKSNPTFELPLEQSQSTTTRRRTEKAVSRKYMGSPITTSASPFNYTRHRWHRFHSGYLTSRINHSMTIYNNAEVVKNLTVSATPFLISASISLLESSRFLTIRKSELIPRHRFIFNYHVLTHGGPRLSPSSTTSLLNPARTLEA
jgi:hypothetical protein